MMGLVEGSVPPQRPLMTGLYNIAVAPFAWSGPVRDAHLAGRLETALVKDLEHWSENVPAIQVRGPDQLDAVEPDARQGDDRSFERVALEHNADVVLAGRFHSAAGRVTVTIEVFLSDRTFGETPEFVGRHEITVTEPVDVLRGNVTLNEELASGALHYLKAVVAFVRGLGEYALNDFAGAEGEFVAAEKEFDRADTVPGTRTARREVLHLMLGNAVGRGDTARVDQAADYYRRALSENPSYQRAKIGLAEATRASVRCRPQEADGRRLGHAVDHYRAALAMASDGDAAHRAFVEMKARLGLGLTYQCLAVGGLGAHWAAANAEFAAVLRLHASAHLSDGSARHALRLAAEARAGEALTAFLTVGRPEEARYGGYPAAATAYEEALRLLHRIDVVRLANLEREVILLRNLRAVYQAWPAAGKLAEVDQRIASVDERLAATAKPGDQGR
jgi:hypothetical protein